MNVSNSMTRLDYPYNASGYLVPQHEIVKGYVRETVHNGIVQSWAISRPVNSPVSMPYGDIVRGKSLTLVLPRPQIEMDPTNPATWQREYRLST